MGFIWWEGMETAGCLFVSGKGLDAVDAEQVVKPLNSEDVRAGDDAVSASRG
jgi:hypothetical protein